MDHPRLPEEVDIRDRHATSGNRDHSREAETAAAADRDGELILGTGHVFRDLGIPNPDLERARSDLASAIIRTLDRQSLSTREAAARTGIAHSEFSRIRNLTLTRFTLDRLFVILNKLDPHVEVVVEVRDGSG